jgi:hypothetical protein
MPTALERRFAKFESQRIALLDRLGAFSDPQHAFQPDPHTWSLAGVVQHVVLVEESLVRYGRRHLDTRPARVSPKSRLRARIVTTVLGFDVRIRAPVAAVVPKTHVPLALLGPRWQTARADLLAYLGELPGPAWAQTAFLHPRTGWITAAGGLRFLHAHVRHHHYQIDRMLASEGFPR